MPYATHPTVDNTSDIYLGEIRLFTCDLVPDGWAECNGQQINTDKNEPLAWLIHRKYGKAVEDWDPDKASFALPNIDPLKDSDYQGETQYYIAIKGRYPDNDEYWSPWSDDA